MSLSSTLTMADGACGAAGRVVGAAAQEDALGLGQIRRGSFLGQQRGGDEPAAVKVFAGDGFDLLGRDLLNPADVAIIEVGIPRGDVVDREGFADVLGRLGAEGAGS